MAVGKINGSSVPFAAMNAVNWDNIGAMNGQTVDHIPPSPVTFYFDVAAGTGTLWTSQGNAVDGSTGTFSPADASEFPPKSGPLDLTSNTCPGTNYGTITKVEMRAYGYENPSAGIFSFHLIPKFNGTTFGNNYDLDADNLNNDWSTWKDITSDGQAPGTWSWTNVADLDARVDVSFTNPVEIDNYVRIAMVELRVTFT